MGWTTVYNSTKKDIINKITERQENEAGIWETVTSTLRGNVLWSVKDWTNKTENKKERYIECALIGYDRSCDGWGYKTMSESMGPCYYSCPLSYLGMVPEPEHNYGWREKVRAYHAARSRKIAIGQNVTLERCKIPYVTIISLRPLMGEYAGVRYRLPRRFIAPEAA